MELKTIMTYYLMVLYTITIICVYSLLTCVMSLLSLQSSLYGCNEGKLSPSGIKTPSMYQILTLTKLRTFCSNIPHNINRVQRRERYSIGAFRNWMT
jgi:hypothetical protein